MSWNAIRRIRATAARVAASWGGGLSAYLHVTLAMMKRMAAARTAARGRCSFSSLMAFRDGRVGWF